MNKEEILKNAEAFAKEVLGKEGTGHDFWHVYRVLSSARKIQEAEGGDLFIIELAVFLHDVGDWKVIGKDEDDYGIAENFLREQEVLEEDIKQVMFIIKNMSFSKTFEGKKKDVSLEFRIVQDADRLDALGAIGVARAFAYGGKKGQLLYNPEVSAQDFSSVEEYRSGTGSTLHHFEEKLFLLKDLMNTKTARAIAEKRELFVKEYVAQFLAEWEGEL